MADLRFSQPAVGSVVNAGAGKKLECRGNSDSHFARRGSGLEKPWYRSIITRKL